MSVPAIKLLEPAVEVPSSRLPKGHEGTEVRFFPMGWEIKSLGEFVALQRGHDLTERDRRKGEVPVMGSAGPNGFHDTAFVFGPGVVLGRSGASFGIAHYCAENFWPHNTALYVTDFFGNDRLFVFYFLKSIDFSRHNSGGAQQSLNRNFIAPIKVVIPPLREQQSIAEALSDADALIESLEQLIAKKRAIKQGAMQELLTGKRRLPGFTGNWNQRPLGELAKIRNEKVNTLDSPEAEFCIELEHISQATGVLEGCSDARGKSTTKYRFMIGDVLFGRLRPYLRKYWKAYRNGVCSTEIWPLIPKNVELDACFLSHVVQTDLFIEAASAAYGTHMPRADWKAMSALNISVAPTIKEQSAVVAILSEIAQEIEALAAKLTKAHGIKQGMMQELLTGRIRLV